MSYSLAFWKYDKGVYLDNQSVYKSVIGEGKQMDGLQSLPANEIREKLKSVFFDWEWLDENNFEHESRGAVSLYITEQAVHINCYSVSNDDMNKLIDIMLSFDCPLYDPQVTTRFDGVD